MTVLSIILGVIMIIGGFTCIFTPVATLLYAGYFICILMFVYGVFGIIRCIMDHGSALEWILNILALIVGIFALVNPGSTLVLDSILMFAIAAFFLIEGVVMIVMAFKTKGFNKNWGWELFGGILSLILGIYACVHPGFNAIAVGVLIGLFFIECGFSTIAFSVASDE